MNRNRSAGHTWERLCINLLKTISYFKNIVSSRSESVNRDAQKVDIMNKDEDENGRLLFDIQCKTTCNSVNYHKIMSEMVIKKIPLILHRKTKKQGKSFYKEEDYAILKMEDFIRLLKQIDFELFKQI